MRGPWDIFRARETLREFHGDEEMFAGMTIISLIYRTPLSLYLPAGPLGSFAPSASIVARNNVPSSLVHLAADPK